MWIQASIICCTCLDWVTAELEPIPDDFGANRPGLTGNHMVQTVHLRPNVQIRSSRATGLHGLEVSLLQGTWFKLSGSWEGFCKTCQWADQLIIWIEFELFSWLLSAHALWQDPRMQWMRASCRTTFTVCASTIQSTCILYQFTFSVYRTFFRQLFPDGFLLGSDNMNLWTYPYKTLYDETCLEYFSQTYWYNCMLHCRIFTIASENAAGKPMRSSSAGLANCIARWPLVVSHLIMANKWHC